MRTIDLYTRLTHRYVGECKDMDEHQLVVTAKATPERVVRYGGEMEEGATTISNVFLPAGTDTRKAARALTDTLSAHGCACEYDCCGCASYYADVKVLGPRRLLARVRTSYNY